MVTLSNIQYLISNWSAMDCWLVINWRVGDKCFPLALRWRTHRRWMMTSSLFFALLVYKHIRFLLFWPVTSLLLRQEAIGGGALIVSWLTGPHRWRLPGDGHVIDHVVNSAAFFRRVVVHSGFNCAFISTTSFAAHSFTNQRYVIDSFI